MSKAITAVASMRSAQGWIHSVPQRLGEALARYRRWILFVQWTVVLCYAVLVCVPAWLPLPNEQAHLWDDLTRFAQFVFWGLWWPFVIVSTMLLGRVWCGVFCPEGALSEAASRVGLGRAIPRWMRWSGWPFVAFASTTVFGQLVSVYEYPKAVLLVLGGSTVAAVVVGAIYGRGKRVWCRHLCPVNGVFRLLARVAPVHYATDGAAWRLASARTPAVDCAPLVDIRHLRSAAACHACGRCAGHRGAVTLTTRSPNSEVLDPDGIVGRWEIAVLIFGMLGLATGAFQWTASPWFVALKQVLATWLVEHDGVRLLEVYAPWWLLTNYPEVNDQFSALDGLCIVLYLGMYTVVIGGWLFATLWCAERFAQARGLLWRLAPCLIPLGGISLFVGLSQLTFGQLAAEGVTVSWLPAARLALLALGFGWSGSLAARILARTGAGRARRTGALLLVLIGASIVPALWVAQFFLW